VRNISEKLMALRNGAEVSLDGKSLQIPDVVAIARYEIEEDKK
jgi:DNA-directed RNA polymerase subunit K/omega